MSDEDLFRQWQDLVERLRWSHGPQEAQRRYDLLADDEEPDLTAWHRLGKWRT